MSVYDQRDRPAYERFEAKPQYAQNPHILKWWTPLHDEILAAQIAHKHWIWYCSITDEIVEATQSLELDTWKDADPLCLQYAWYNVLMYFAASRAEQIGLTKAIRQPKWTTCLLCQQRFIESSLPAPLIDRLGIDNLDFCAPCLRDTVIQGSGNSSASKEDICKYLQELAVLLGHVPTQNFGEGATDLLDFNTAERSAILKCLREKPTLARVKTVFGSWLSALIIAGILEDGTRKTSRGIQSIAKDGHVCLSLGEKTIDDFLYLNGISHDKEPRYPEGNYRADFLVNGVFIEYFGLAGNPDYDTRAREKVRICKKHGITLIALYPQDLVNHRKLTGKLLPLKEKGKKGSEPFNSDARL
jgi:hypothetical protein